MAHKAIILPGPDGSNLFAQYQRDKKMEHLISAKETLEKEIRMLEKSVKNNQDCGLSEIEDRNELNAMNNELRKINSEIAKINSITAAVKYYPKR